jgi:hypothetical protein
MFRLRASHVSGLITGAVAAVVGVFTVAFSVLLSQAFGQVPAASNFFGGASAMMYVTIEGLFLMLLLFGAYVTVRKK